MASRIFRFYSLEPEAAFRKTGENWQAAIVRRSGRKVGGSSIFYVTIVLDDLQAAGAFEEWLAREAPSRDIRRYVGRAGRDRASVVYKDVPFHRGGMASRLRLPIDTFWGDISRYWLTSSRLVRRLWLRFMA